MKRITVFYFLGFLLFFISCDKNRIFEKYIDFENSEWSYENNASFEVSIKDTASKKLFINFRHTYFFKTRNVLLKMHVEDPKGKKETIHLNIPLSEPNGKWYADCSGDICSIQKEIEYAFTDTGKYLFWLEQDMRVNPLTNVLSVGLRVEKTNQPK